MLGIALSITMAIAIVIDLIDIVLSIALCRMFNCIVSRCTM